MRGLEQMRGGCAVDRQAPAAVRGRAAASPARRRARRGMPDRRPTVRRAARGCAPQSRCQRSARARRRPGDRRLRARITSARRSRAQRGEQPEHVLRLQPEVHGRSSDGPPLGKQPLKNACTPRPRWGRTRVGSPTDTADGRSPVRAPRPNTRRRAGAAPGKRPDLTSVHPDREAFTTRPARRRCGHQPP